MTFGIGESVPPIFLFVWSELRLISSSHMASLLLLKKLTLTVLYSSLLLLIPSTSATSVKYCDKRLDYPVKVHGVKISPDPVVVNKPAKFKISASTGQTITGGKVIIEVSYFGLHVHTETHNLSEEMSCPIAVGNFELSHTQTLPLYTPPGSYTLKMTIKDDKFQLLTCISFDFKISIFPISAD